VSVGFVGMGNMGQMLVRALVRAEVLPMGEILVSTRNPEKLLLLSNSLPGIRTLATNGELARNSRTIFLCIKPNETAAVLREIAPYMTADHLVVTITNTLDIAQLEAMTPARIAKVIPSMVQQVGAGISLLMFGDRCTGADRAEIQALFEPISTPVVIKESDARVASDLASCGPAFLAFTWRAMSQAARQYAPTLPPEVADTLVRRTAAATCLLLESMGYNFDDVIAKVSTPGGVTAEGIKVLEEQMSGVWEQVIETTIIKENAKRAKVTLT